MLVSQNHFGLAIYYAESAISMLDFARKRMFPRARLTFSLAIQATPTSVVDRREGLYGVQILTDSWE